MQMQHRSAATDAAEALPLSFVANTVTGTQSLPMNIDRGLSARSVAESIAERLALPDDTSWVLRNDDSTYLDDSRSIGEQIAPGSNVTIAPRAHLGGGSQAGR
jgi:hypothetical protein